MKRLARTTLGILLASAGIASAEDASLLPEARRLKQAYSTCAGAPGDRKALQAYLEAFPADLRTFTAVFPAEEHRQLDDGQGYIALLGEIGRQHPEATFDKLLRLESGVRWEAGSLDHLQQVTLRLALRNPRAFASALTGLRPRERRGVAVFLADGPDGPPEETLGLAAKLELAGFPDLAGGLRDEAALSEAHQARS